MFKNLSIRAKIIGLIVFIVLLVVLISTSVAIYRESQLVEKNLVEKNNTAVRIVASNIQAALEFEDSAQALKIVKTLFAVKDATECGGL